MIDTFDEELKVLIESGLTFDELVPLVAELHAKHGREVPRPIEGTVALTERKDGFGLR
jgi:hypothetical protein